MDVDSLLPESALARTASLLSAVHRAREADLNLTSTACVHFLRNFTIELIEPYLDFHLLRSRIQPSIHFGDFGVIGQALLDENSDLRSSSPDLLVMALMLEELDPAYPGPGWTAEQALADLEALLDLAQKHSPCMVIVNTFLPPFYYPQGLARGGQQVRVEDEVARLNRYIRHWARAHADRFVLVDWERLVRLLGKEASLDERFWYSARAPFPGKFLDQYAREICRIVRALMGQAKKCLVLDCDNTLWGGIVGEDGLAGIVLDDQTWPGRAYYEFQRSLLFLHERGTLLALCSRNNEADVWEVFDRHSRCLLGRRHLAGWRINWAHKVDNLVSLADELNLGLDGFVFVDDSEVECQLVRQALPQVTVRTVPKSLHRLPSLLFTEGLFDTLAVSREDRRRTALYHQASQRTSARQEYADLGEFLESLDTVANVRLAREEDLARVAQLTQKTNQFNLTTRRYSAAEIAHLADQPDWLVLAMRVQDRFGDLGLTGVCLVHRDGGDAVVDSFLMSCRILGRDLEWAFLDSVAQAVGEAWKPTGWRATYIPTPKNGQTESFWQRAGLHLVGQQADHTSFAAEKIVCPKGYRQFTKVTWDLGEEHDHA